MRRPATNHRSRLAIVGALIMVVASSFTGRAIADGTPSIVTDSLNALRSLAATCVARDAADDSTANGSTLPYRFCDDGPNLPGMAGIPVPAAYHPDSTGDDYTGLPAPGTLDDILAAQIRDDIRPEPPGDRVTLDVDISLPPSTMTPPASGFPMIVVYHGGGGDKTEWETTTIDGASAKGNLNAAELWHRSNSWFSSRGYVVITFSQRLSAAHASIATLQVSRRYDVNDAQYLAGLLADDDKSRIDAGGAPLFNVNPSRIAVTGYSSGGMLSWITLTDWRWFSPLYQRFMSLAAVAPFAGFTDMMEILAPSGHSFDRDPWNPSKASIDPDDMAMARSRAPFGILKQSFLITLLCTGDPEVVFNRDFQQGCKRLTAGGPYLSDDPLLKAMADHAQSDMSAYFSPAFFNTVALRPGVPVFAVQGWTDPITPPIETIRFYNKLRSVYPGYPIQLALGDVGHYAANRIKEWADLCGAGRHVCELADYTRPDGTIDFMSVSTRVRKGLASEINGFLDSVLYQRGTPPAYDVSSTERRCPALTSDPSAEPGPTYHAATLHGLATAQRRIQLTGSGESVWVAPDPHGATDDPSTIRGEAYNRGAPIDLYYVAAPSSDPGPGVVSLSSTAMTAPLSMAGIPTVRLSYIPTGVDYHVVGRLYDRDPSGSMTLVTRGPCAVNQLSAPSVDCSTFDLWGNAWTFGTGHQIVLEITQDDAPLFRPDNEPSTLTIAGATIDIPAR